ncbi:hypothetical protein [Photobacterium profundum]|uniref:HTH cro/C1-type domain-containing protein n=1 Tax=Photobacterium profundum (strain SS9) TaxID=298386 RepID=Q6LJU6_PHOPR|nr:hypothetical protein [Photobacterium profundum]CAG22434.1 hypothetical protein PBPRB0561 [Photobacterium profundum SS9]
MKSIYDIRCDNLTKIRNDFRSTREMAVKLDIHEQAMGQLLRGNRKLGNALARRFEELLGLQANVLDQTDATIPNEINEIALVLAEKMVKGKIPPAKVFALIDALLMDNE